MFRRRWERKDDAALMRAVAGGSEGAFEALLSRHQPGILNFAYRFLGDADEARDVAQEVFLRLYRNADTWRPEGGLKPWLFRIAKNLCIDHGRKLRPEIPGSVPEPIQSRTPLDALNGKEGMAAISAGVRRLPESQRTAILLRHTEELSYAEIAAAMGTSVGAVESLLVRGRRSLREFLKGT